MDKDKKDKMDTKTNRLDQRTMQCSGEESPQYYCYFSADMLETLGLTKGSKLVLVLQDDKIEVYPQEKFLAKGGFIGGQQS